ncbi:hypothetical protein PIB30_032079, partial [Stylosanthes scabra]|nr:hypothetical protein [Stylosanthes scabra]
IHLAQNSSLSGLITCRHGAFPLIDNRAYDYELGNGEAMTVMMEWLITDLHMAEQNDVLGLGSLPMWKKTQVGIQIHEKSVMANGVELGLQGGVSLLREQANT